MLKLEVSTAVGLYLFFSVIIILLLWIFSGYKGDGGKEHKLDDKYIWHCSICDHTYVDSIHEGISKCPRCSSYVEREDNSTIQGRNSGRRIYKNF